MTERQQRRLAAILAADIAGYSALMGADEARTVRDLKAHQTVVLPMIARFSGRLIDTAGDGILAEFASAADAMECSSAIQETMAAQAKREDLHSSDFDDKTQSHRQGLSVFLSVV